MKQPKKTLSSPEMLPDYDLSGGIRGKYFNKYTSGTNLVKLDADVAEAFPSSECVNMSLRALVQIYKGSKIKV